MPNTKSSTKKPVSYHYNGPLRVTTYADGTVHVPPAQLGVSDHEIAWLEGEKKCKGLKQTLQSVVTCDNGLSYNIRLCNRQIRAAYRTQKRQRNCSEQATINEIITLVHEMQAARPRGTMARVQNDLRIEEHTQEHKLAWLLHEKCIDPDDVVAIERYLARLQKQYGG